MFWGGNGAYVKTDATAHGHQTDVSLWNVFRARPWAPLRDEMGTSLQKMKRLSASRVVNLSASQRQRERVFRIWDLSASR